MSDDTHLDDDVFSERPETEDANDPFASLMDLSAEMGLEGEAPEAEAIIEPQIQEGQPQEPFVSPAHDAPSADSHAEVALDDFLSAEFDAPEPVAPPLSDAPIMDQDLDEDALLTALDADFSAQETIDSIIDAPVAPPVSDAPFEDDFGLADMGLGDHAPAPAIAPIEAASTDEPFDLDDLNLDDIDLSQSAHVDAPEIHANNAPEIDLDLDALDLSDEITAAPEPLASTDTFDIDDFLNDELSDDLSLGEASEQPMPEASTPDAVSAAITAATSLSASDAGWLGAEPINQEAEIGHAETPVISADPVEEIDPFQDLALDLDLDAPEAEAPNLSEAEINNALRDAEVDEQIQSLEAHYAAPETLPEPETEPDHAENIADDENSTSTLGGLAAAGAVGLGLSKVFGSSAKAEAETPVKSDEALELDDLDQFLGDLSGSDAPQAAPDAASEVNAEINLEIEPEIDIADFQSDMDSAFDLEPQIKAAPQVDTVEVPTVNIVEPHAQVPETGTISVPHVDYDVPVEPVAPTPDAFEQAISDSFAEMQDDDLLADTDLRPAVEDDLNIALGDIDFDMESAISSDEAYRTVIADEMGASQTAIDPEFDGLINDGLDFNEAELDGLRREAGHNDEAVGNALPLSEMTGIAAANEAAKKPSNRKGLLIAACLVGVAVIAGAVGFGSSFLGNEGDDQSALVLKSDTDGVKEVPTEPSGTEVANKDSEVFQGSATSNNGQNEQAALVDNREPLVGENSTKDLNRINPEDTALSDASKAVEDAAQSVMTPRRVQTLVVRPDGSIAPAGEAAPVAENTSETPVADDDSERLLASTPNTVGSDIEAVPQRTVNTVVVRNNETPRIAPRPSAPAQPSVNSQITPDVVPIVPSRPANQPVNIVNNNAQIAAVRPQAPAAPAAPTPAVSAPAGTYFVQIASTPSEADARSTGNRLTSRFSSVFGGRGFVVRRAVIEGKGTFYRVRVPGGTRNEANALCSRYKSAGGSCFVSR